ncbi:MAG: diguanylate cyclase [Oscillospiraceae bacterium]
MEDKDLLVLQLQIQNMILNKPPDKSLKIQSEQYRELEEEIMYLSENITQANDFITKLANGDLETKIPDRHNFISSSLKELHANLCHLTWQASRVANGDYSQRVSHLGAFSNSFNQMIKQLQERENKLVKQSNAIMESKNLLLSIMDGMSDWVAVVEEKTNTVLYTNHITNEHLYDETTKKYVCGSEFCGLMEYLNNYSNKKGESESTFYFDCPIKNKSLQTRTFSIHWSEKRAFVHIISDVTGEKKEKEKLETLAFNDELTGLFNRRYCISKLSSLMYDTIDFCVCLIDLDGLKKVNDRLGHTVGDDYIQSISTAMKKTMPHSCRICRVGGDEFIIIMPTFTIDLANDYLNKLDKEISLIKRNYTLSVSGGIIHVNENSKLSPEEIMEQVDEKMYAVKKKKYELIQNNTKTEY